MKKILLLASIIVLASCSNMDTRQSSSGMASSGSAASGIESTYSTYSPNGVMPPDPTLLNVGP